MFNYLQSPILLTGIERSGSGIIARILQMAGAYTGATTSRMENRALKSIVDTYYKKIQCDIYGQFPIPHTRKIKIDTCWNARVVKSLKESGYTGQSPWMYKSSRIGQVWPLWNNAFPDAKYIIVRRRSGDVIKSCLCTAYMHAYQREDVLAAIGASNEIDGWKWWIHHHEDRFVEMMQNGLNCKVVWPDRMLDNDFTSIIELVEWVGLKWNDDIIPNIDKLLHKKKYENYSGCR